MVALGDYEVGRTLGVGATGRVRLGRHKETGHLVALKIVPRNLLLHGGHVARAVRREIAVLRLIASGNTAAEGVLALYDVIDTADSTMLALEYCPGGDLFELLLHRGRLPLPLVRDYFAQLAKAVYVCHKRGICHRDLKPENILISSDGKLKIADFGMSGLLNPVSLLETSCGSPHYCAPEVLSGQRYTGAEADTYSLGVILFAMVTGGLPFDDDNLRRLTRKVASGVFYMPPEVPENVAALIRNMLVVNPAHRMPLDAVLKSDWLGEGALPPVLECDSLQKELPPVTSPDPRIISYLASLGLGNDFMLRRRLSGKRDCLEREMYYRFASVLHAEQSQPMKVPTVTRTPTSITASACFDEEAPHEQASLEQTLAEMRLSEPFREPPSIMETPREESCVPAVPNCSAQSLACGAQAMCVGDLNTTVSSNIAGLSLSSSDPACGNPSFERFNSESGNGCSAVVQEGLRVTVLNAHGHVPTLQRAQIPSRLNVFDMPGNFVPLSQR